MYIMTHHVMSVSERHTLTRQKYDDEESTLLTLMLAITEKIIVVFVCNRTNI